MSGLRIQGLAFSYAGAGSDDRAAPVLDQLDLNVGRGALLVVLGPNGVGTSTLLKLVAGLLPFREGVIQLDALDLTGLSARERARRVAYLPQLSASTEVSVFEAVLLGRLPHLGVGPGQRDLAVVDRTLRALGLAPLSARRVTRLSGGELQKVLIARALVQEPQLLLLDEPVNHLDLRNQMAVLRSIQAQARERQLATLVVLHDINLALRFADQFLLMGPDATSTQGPIADLAPEAVGDAYGIEVIRGEVDGRPVMVPV
jgi:iron complex transport system ATP-binding protein